MAIKSTFTHFTSFCHHEHIHPLTLTQAACKELAERNEDLSRIIDGTRTTIRIKEEEAALLHVRLAEQLSMLDLSFSRRCATCLH